MMVLLIHKVWFTLYTSNFIFNKLWATVWHHFSYFSVAVTRNHDQVNLQKNSFHWGLASRFSRWVHDHHDGSMAADMQAKPKSSWELTSDLQTEGRERPRWEMACTFETSKLPYLVTHLQQTTPPRHSQIVQPNIQIYKPMVPISIKTTTDKAFFDILFNIHAFHVNNVWTKITPSLSTTYFPFCDTIFFSCVSFPVFFFRVFSIFVIF